MTNDIEAFLRDLQGVVASVHLYPAGHPRLGDLVSRVVSEAATLTTGAAEFSVFQADNRLVWQGAPLPGGDTLARGVFTTMREHGFHRLTVRRGLNDVEVLAFANAVAAGAPRGDVGLAALRSSAHLRLSSIDTGDDAAQQASIPEFTRRIAGDQSLERVWDGVYERRQLDFDAVDVMVMSLTRTLEDSASAMLPLAQLKSHDEYTVTHIANVALLATALGESLGLPASVLRDVGVAALLHDIGKLRVPAEILNHAGHLDDHQRALIQRHPEDGARILLATGGVPEVAVAVAFEHHMHHDGVGGYPQVSRPWTMNLVSEMTHIADVFDALRSNRPYRKGMSRDRIAAIMRHDAGTVFDPDLVEVFFSDIVTRTEDVAA